MQGSQLQRLVEVMNTLRSPGGCPWDAEQTHESLLKYLLEESYEFVDAVQSENRIDMREELGDVLLQVYFHARMAQEHPTDPFSIEDVARGIAEKLIRRHPHVFDGVEVRDTQEVVDNWEEIKKREKGRTSALDGVAMSQPALPLIEKLLYRAEKYNVEVTTPDTVSIGGPADENAVGQALVAVIAWAHANGIDAEAALRKEAMRISGEIGPA
ncbi:MAG: nucleoside triphosphate hydrolase [Actinobacteria bacterium BACL15 MAG-120619-bin91]|jgi:XTP/dITP diphosphohydrolase|uniref:Nucleoside triphosphate hydrolase n=1 Tax=Actinobacteria bacterium BACL15 MAG-120619-bin91 TaxID=1655562 RepID=A0A0R2PBZ9_9ACTN|nr:MAG: nucleoside triphosphate hydrolase [Actinobacteria bacterium BACL15 MAG-120619-bin91]